MVESLEERASEMLATQVKNISQVWSSRLCLRVAQQQTKLEFAMMLQKAACSFSARRLLTNLSVEAARQSWEAEKLPAVG